MLEIKNVTVRFSGAEVKAVDDVSLTVRDGEHTAIVGETGSGKSVLLLALLRLLPKNAVIGGDVLLDGQNLLALPKKQLRHIRGKKISYIPQGSGSMNPLYKVARQVGEPLVIHNGMSIKESIRAVLPLFDRFDLCPVERTAGAYPHELSGGMRQRALIAMGISAGAEILLADEPTKGLDPERVKAVKAAFKALTEKTILCVTHDIAFARSFSENVCVMYAAQQLEYGRTSDVLADPLHPYTRDLLNALPENGMKTTSAGFAPPHDSYLNEFSGCRYRDRCANRTEKCKAVPPVADVNGHKVRCWKYAL